MDSNPFVYERALRPPEFIGRSDDLRTVWEAVLGRRNVVITGEAHAGKTSFVRRLFSAEEVTQRGGIVMAPGRLSLKETRRQATGVETRTVAAILSVLDGQLLRGLKTQESFWERALTPVRDLVGGVEEAGLGDLRQEYEGVRANGFGTWVLERFFDRIDALGYRVVLLLDEFDDLLAHPVLHSGEFYGGLRTFASAYDGLVVLLCSRLGKDELERRSTASLGELSRTSPYFNCFGEVTLGRLKEADLAALLAFAGKDLIAGDLEFIASTSGMQPFVAQVTASVLWEFNRRGELAPDKYVRAGDAVFAATRGHYAYVWANWSDPMKIAATLITLRMVPRAIHRHEIDVGPCSEELKAYRAEIVGLEKRGMVARDPHGEPVIGQGAFVAWLIDDLRRHVNGQQDFVQWLRRQGADSGVGEGSKERLGVVAGQVVNATRKGAGEFMGGFLKVVGVEIARRILTGGL